MCWIGKISDKRIAKKDMIVHKVLMKFDDGESVTYSSPYQHSKYKLGKQYETKICPHTFGSKPEEGLIWISFGLHCYSTDCWHTRANGGYKEEKPYMIVINFKKEGEFITYRKYCDGYPTLMKAVIPAGTTYYENKKGEIVAEKLIIKEEFNYNILDI